MTFATAVFDSDAFLVDVIWRRARQLVTEKSPEHGAKAWSALSLETRLMFFERAAEILGVGLR